MGRSFLDVSNCTAQAYDTGLSTGWGEGRFITSTQLGQGGGHVHRRQHGEPVRGRPRNPNQNAGEQILCEAGVGAWEGPVGSATPTTITFNPGTIAPNYNEELVIVAGTGFGQVRDISNIATSSGGYTLTVARPWNVTPDATSQLQIVEQPERWAVYDNNQSGTAAMEAQSSATANCGLKCTTAGRTWWSTTTRIPTSGPASIFMTRRSMSSTGNAGVVVHGVEQYLQQHPHVTIHLDGQQSRTVVGPQILADLWRDNTVNTVLVRPSTRGARATSTPVPTRCWTSSTRTR